MPTFSCSLSFHWPQFLHFHSSRSKAPNRSLPRPHNDATTPSSHELDTCHPSSPPPLPSLCVLEQLENTAPTGIFHPPTPGSSVDRQISTGGFLNDRIVDDSGSQPLPASRRGTLKGIVRSNTANILNSHGPGTQHSTLPTSSSNHRDSFQAPHSLAPPPAPYSPATSSQCSSNSQLPTESSSQYSPKLQHRNQGMFHEAHDFTVTGTFIDAGRVAINTSNQFMKELLENTIPGAASDSSDRDPPPRCHPGTRLAILDRCLYFIRTCDGHRKMRWVVGAAGVGKSAVMQSVAESPELPVGCHASVFFSINGRNNGTRTIITISYQFAAKFNPYRELIEEEIARDPSLLQSSMAKQFLKLIIEPFVLNPQLSSNGRVLIIIDGLDECDNSGTQLELLRLITDLCITYPSSPLVWLIASRPETHITSFFDGAEVELAYEKEEIVVDSNEARADVERFLRDELMKIKKQASDSLDSQWPKEQDFWKLANASGGLFAYARTVIRYIGDSTISSPALQLSDVLNVIDNNPMVGISSEEHPMALLDALYARILSKVPPRMMMNTRRLLLALASNWHWDHNLKGNLIVLCNWLGMTPDEAYAAINHLRSVLYVPRRHRAHRNKLEAFHKSFTDYICDVTRSGFSREITAEAQELMNECAFRILKEASDGIDFGDMDYRVYSGCLAQGPGAGDSISLTWPADKGVSWNDDDSRLGVYKLAIGQVIAGMKRGDPTFQNTTCIQLLTTRFQSYETNFPRYELRDLVFDESRRHEFTKYGILGLIPLKSVDISRIIYEIKLQFRRCATKETNVSDSWNSSCEHQRSGVWEEANVQDWTTLFYRPTSRRRICIFCTQRLRNQVRSLAMQSPDHSVPVLFTSTGECCVEIQFADPEDDMSEWTYWFWIRPPA